MADKNNFLYEYIRNRGMQNMTKTEYEQVLFYYFICKEKLFSKNDVTSLSAKELYSISDELGIDIQKVKALIKKMPYVRDSDRTKGSEKSFYQIIMEHLSTSSDTLAKGYLELSLENPLELERVKRLIAENGGKTDTSFSNSILKIPFGSVSQVLPVAEQKELTEKICEVLESVKKQLPDRENELSKEVNDTIKTPKLDKVLSVLEQVSRIGVNVTESFANIFSLKYFHKKIYIYRSSFMKNFLRCRNKFGMTRTMRGMARMLSGLALAAAIVVGFASCETEVEKIVTQEVDKKADETAPAAVTNLTATAKDSRVLLTWTDAADSDIYGYEVSYSGSKAINRVVLPALDSTSMMVPQGAGGTYISGLTNGTEYTFTVKTVDISGNKSEGVTSSATPLAVDASQALQIVLTADVPHENGYTGNKSNTKVTVTVNITSASNVKKVVWKKDGTLIAKTLLADTAANAASVSDDNAKWAFDITATDETANGTYTVAAIDEAGREEAEQITIDNFDFTAPGKVKVTNAVYSSDLSAIILNWTEPGDSDYDHVDISFTSNDGTADSEPSTVESVTKGTANKTYSGIDASKAYYTYTFVTYDELGNKGADYTYKVSVNTSVNNIPEGFVEVTGTTITGSESWTPSSSVFVSGRSLTIPDLIVCDHEVTRGEFKALMGEDPSTASAYDKDGNELTGDDVLNNPVNYVNWYAAIAYCNKLSVKEGLDCAYTVSGITDWENLAYSSIPTSSNDTWNASTCNFEASGYRLPTEAEWEWLARGGQNYTYAGSDTVDDVAWYTGNTNDTGSRDVKTKAANGYGLYDMSGNVWEWCWDWYGSISSSTDAAGAASGSCRVVRGGSWNNNASNCTVSCRDFNSPYYRYYNLGFRVVRSSSN